MLWAKQPGQTFSVLSVNMTDFPIGTVLTYFDVDEGEFVTTNVTDSDFVWSLTGSTERELRDLLDGVELQPPLHFAGEFVVSSLLVDDSGDPPVTYDHVVTIAAIADTPGVAVTNITVNEDTSATLNVSTAHSADRPDNSEVLSIVF